MWEQTKACQEGAEIIVATPVSIHPYPHIHLPITHTHTHTQTDQGLSGGGRDHCGHACKYTPLHPHTHTHPSHTNLGLSLGAEMIMVNA